MDYKRHIPNTLTLLNLFCGCLAVTFVADGQYGMAFFFVALGIFFDFFDGFFARMLNVPSELGLQLDSLADMVTSGVVPGYVMFQLMSAHVQPIHPWFPYLGFIITLGACYRLANFNIDTRQSDSFIGLPTPANALFFLSLPLIKSQTESLLVLELLLSPWVLLVLALLSAWIMNAEIPLFSLKVKQFSWSKNWIQVFFLGVSALLLILLQIAAIPLIIVFYILSSVILNRRK